MSDSARSAAEEQARPKTRTASAVSEFLRAAIDATDDLERVWSSALDGATAGKGQADYKVLVGQALGRMEAWVAEVGERLAPTQLDRLSTGFPLQVKDLASLSTTPTGDDQIQQLWIAVFYALRDAASSFAALATDDGGRPSAREGERMGSFWEAGSFTLLRQRVLGLAELIDRLTAALGERAEEFGLASEDLGDSLAAPEDRTSFVRAQTLVRLGFHDAALPLLLQDLNELLRPALDTRENGAPIGVQVDADLHRVLAMLAETSARMGQGGPVPPEVAVPLAETLVALLPGLVVMPTEPAAPGEPSAPAAGASTPGSSSDSSSPPAAR